MRKSKYYQAPDSSTFESSLFNISMNSYSNSRPAGSTMKDSKEAKVKVESSSEPKSSSEEKDIEINKFLGINIAT